MEAIWFPEQSLNLNVHTRHSTLWWKLNKSLLIIIISLLVNMGNMVVVNPVFTQPSTVLYVDPPSIIDTTKTPGTNFTININIKDVTDLYKFNFDLTYEKRVLTATNITLGSFFPSNLIIPPYIYINDYEGYANLNVRLNTSITKVGVSGNGTLATIRFIVDALGESDLYLSNTILFDSGGRLIEHGTLNGYFINVVPVTKLYVDPPSIIDTTKTPGTNFTININIKDVTDLFSYDLKLMYDTTLLNVATVSIGSFFPNPQKWRNETNEESGYVWYAVSMPAGSKAGVSGSGTLLTISFNVTSTGETILDLYTVKILNHISMTIPKNVYDGYFSNILRLTKLYVDPENTINPDLVAGKNFTINVNILNATLLYGFDFFLNYTTTVLTATNVTLGPFSSGSQIVHVEINDILGYVQYNVVMPGVTGDGILANITFTVDSIGESRLDLCNTRLVDSAGQPIEHDTLDGYFSNKPIIHDIAITNIITTVTTVEVENGISISVTKHVSEVHAGEKVNVTVSVENNGTISETFNVTAYYDDTVIGILKNVTLTEGFKTSLIFEWNTEGVAAGNYSIWAETSDVEGDINPNNNKFTMEGGFKVLASPLPTELIVAAVASVSIIAVTLVYFIKFRKPKPVAEGTLSESKG